MWSPDYFVRLVELPYSVHAVTIPNDDGSFDIYINSLLPREQQLQKLRHEIAHIRRDHFYCWDSICAIEDEANEV